MTRTVTLQAVTGGLNDAAAARCDYMRFLPLLLRTMSVSAITLYTNRMCPYAQRVAIALEHSGLQHDKVEVDLYGSKGFTKKDLKAVETQAGLSPKGYIPVLSIDDETLRESTKCVERIGALAPVAPRMPRRPQAVAHCDPDHARGQGRRLFGPGLDTRVGARPARPRRAAYTRFCRRRRVFDRRLRAAPVSLSHPQGTRDPGRRVAAPGLPRPRVRAAVVPRTVAAPWWWYYPLASRRPTALAPRERATPDGWRRLL